MRHSTILWGLVTVWALTVLPLVGVAQAAAPAKPAATSGVAEFVPVADQSNIPERFRLERHTFPYQMVPQPTIGNTMSVSAVTFPSPVVTPHENNNTVHTEYFSPK